MEIGYVVGDSWTVIGATKAESETIKQFGWQVANAPRPLDYGGKGPGNGWFLGFTWHSPNGGIDTSTARVIPSGAWGTFAAANADVWMTDGYGGSVTLKRSWEMDNATELLLLSHDTFASMVRHTYEEEYSTEIGAWEETLAVYEEMNPGEGVLNIARNMGLKVFGVEPRSAVAR